MNPLTIDVHIFTGLDKDLLTPEQVSEVEQEMNTLVEKFEREVNELAEELITKYQQKGNLKCTD